MRTTILRTAVVLMSLSLFFAGCATTRSVPVPKEPATNVRVYVGDRVEVVTNDGQTHRFTVTAKEPDALVGQHVRVAYADMRSLTVVTSNAPQVAKVTLIVIAVAVVAALIYFFQHAGALAG